MWFVSNKTTVRESGLLEGFCDCHSHLLAGVDDGVEEMDETLQILRLWQSVGMKEVWLTPHVMEDIPNEPAALRRRLAALQDRYDGNIRLHLAAEYMMDGLFLPRLEEHDVLTENDHRLLVETSYYIPPMNMEAILDSIRKKGFEPILAHPERYQYMDKDDYRYWKERGVLMQLNLPSLVGAYGPDVQYKAEWLLLKNMYDYCGTDTHSLEQAELFLDGIISQKVVKKVRRINTLLT